MVRPIAITFVIVALSCSMGWAQNEPEVTLSTGWKHSVGIGMLTWPETAKLTSSDNMSVDLQLQYLGAVLVGRSEKRWTSSGLSLRYGIGQAQYSASSLGNEILYSTTGQVVQPVFVGADYLEYFSRTTSMGIGLLGMQYSFHLPTPSSPGVKYTFLHGNNEVKGLVTFYLRWQVLAGWYLDQTMMLPISPEVQTAWMISLLKRY